MNSWKLKHTESIRDFNTRGDSNCIRLIHVQLDILHIDKLQANI